VNKKKIHTQMQWYSIDLHLHTPASSDFQQPDVKYLEILQRAEARGLDIIAFTDHNTVAGYRKLQDELQQLELLERLNRILPEEQNRLREYRRLFEKLLILPAFEFTATFGFHIIGLFPPETPVREIEHLLIDLNIPTEQLDLGSATVGATTDVLTAYRMIDEAGGIVIAAHANSTNGVAMRLHPGSSPACPGSYRSGTTWIPDYSNFLQWHQTGISSQDALYSGFRFPQIEYRSTTQEESWDR
jgi:hypothetical protein